MSTELLEKAKAQPKQAPSPASVPLVNPSHGGPPAANTQARYDFEDEDDGPGFFRSNLVSMGIIGLFIGAAFYAFSGPSKPTTITPQQKNKVQQVRVIVPPPLPPPPPKVEPPREEMEKEVAPEEEPPPDDTPADPAPAVVSNGPAGNDGFGLAGKKSASGNNNARKLGGNRSRFGAYPSQVQSTISGAIRRNSKTKSSNMSLIARIWVDDTGRVTRATLSGSSGDPAIDDALKNEVLTGLQLQAPPPMGMKMPINLKLTTRASR